MAHKFFLLIFCALTPFLIDAQTTSGTIEHDETTRDYILHLPTDYDASKSYPFVYNLHGFGSNAAQQQFYTEMDGTSDSNGFIVCYPNGLANSWNVGWNFGSNADDVDFLLTLVDTLAVDYNINYDRLYSCGMSNGGFMSYKLACEASDKFAAIASITGSIIPSELAICDPIRKMPVMQIHGTADPTVAYSGSNIGAPIEDVVGFWAERNLCDLTADTIQIEDINSSDQCTAERIQYVECDEEVEVVFYKIEGGEHTWPDALIDIGVTNRDFNANQEIWNFFNRFDLNGPILSNNKEVAIDSGISLFPNPANSQISLSNLPIGNKRIIIVDAVGKIIVSKTSSSENVSSIDIEGLGNGLHFLIVEGEYTREIAKFIKL